MGNSGKRTASFLFVLSLLTLKVTGRLLQQYSSSEFVSDGVDRVQDDEPSFLLLRGMDFSSEQDRCEQMYGFLPCSYSLMGHLFLIVVYEYLLFHGESYVITGGERIFKILGPGVFGASAFQILGALPESLILLASGLVDKGEGPQEYVQTAVGLLAGTTILLLTLLWGTCVILGSQDFPTTSNVGENHLHKQSSLLTVALGLSMGHFSLCHVVAHNWADKMLSPVCESNPPVAWAGTGNGVTTDMETSYTARIMGHGHELGLCGIDALEWTPIGKEQPVREQVDGGLRYKKTTWV
ncbi:unnamed protein product [Ilex paraguariensis]|uniref:Sodium/calcium exchanger membrane region domain-containing protein n=1 Tax=Ilex paraguariensis TaxID=185542 RepID=A0ABC8UPF6_9AQUA